MYNEEQKIKFAKEYTDKISVRETIERVFDVIEPFEIKWGSDICTRSAEEIQPAFDAAAGLRNQCGNMPRQILHAYASWCMQHDVPGARDDMLRVNSVSANKLKRQMIGTPARLQWYLNQICEPESDQTTGNTVRAYLWLAFSGMREDDVFQVKCSDVDFRRAVVHFNGVDYPIYREAFPAFLNCVELTRFIYKHPNYSADVVSYRDRVDGDLLLRGFRAMPNKNTMNVEVSRRRRRVADNHDINMNLSYHRVWLSGIFYRMWEREQAGMPIDFEEQARQYSNGKVYKVNSGGNTQAAKHRAIAKELEIDYQRWKQIL